MKGKAKKRPAESVGLAGAAALLVARAAGIDDAEVITALGMVFAAAPAAVTWVVAMVRGA